MTRNARRWLVMLVLALLYYWVFVGLDVSDVNLAARWPQAVGIFRLMVTEPDWGFIWICNVAGCYSELGTALVESLLMAIVGTGVAALLAVPFGFLAARMAGKVGRATALGKFQLNAIRAFPELILAVLMAKAVGFGPPAGVLAIGIHSIGMLGKLYAEVVESIDLGVTEAMSATGAGRAQSIWFGVIPQVLPEFASYALYRFEINMRAATVLGIVGAGGIGAPLIFAVVQREWGRVGIILIGVMILVSLVDTLSSWLRSKLV